MAFRLGRLLRSSSHPVAARRFLCQIIRFKTTDSSVPPPVHRPANNPAHHPPHEYLKPNEFLGSWKSPPPSSDPKEAQKRLALLRRDYAKQMKAVRREYAYEMELERQEKQRKDEARLEAVRKAKEERKSAKAAVAKTRAAERKALEDEFRQTLLKERAEKLEYWRAQEAKREQKKGEKNELLRRQSSVWIDEIDLEKKLLEAIVDTTPL